MHHLLLLTANVDDISRAGLAPVALLARILFPQHEPY